MWSRDKNLDFAMLITSSLSTCYWTVHLSLSFHNVFSRISIRFHWLICQPISHFTLLNTIVLCVKPAYLPRSFSGMFSNFLDICSFKYIWESGYQVPRKSTVEFWLELHWIWVRDEILYIMVFPFMCASFNIFQYSIILSA